MLSTNNAHTRTSCKGVQTSTKTRSGTSKKKVDTTAKQEIDII